MRVGDIDPAPEQVPTILEDDNVQLPAPLPNFPVAEAEVDGDEEEVGEEEVESVPQALLDKGKSVAPPDEAYYSEEEYDCYGDDDADAYLGDPEEEMIGALFHLGL